MSDLERTFKWHNDERLYDTLIGNWRPITREIEQAWLLTKIGHDPRCLNLAICTRGGDHIGLVYLNDIDLVAKKAQLDIFIGEPQDRGRGYGRAAVKECIRRAFEELGLQRVYLFVLADNEAAIRTYAACGLVEEGTLRRHAFKSGEFKDVKVMAICK